MTVFGQKEEERFLEATHEATLSDNISSKLYGILSKNYGIAILSDIDSAVKDVIKNNVLALDSKKLFNETVDVFEGLLKFNALTVVYAFKAFRLDSKDANMEEFIYALFEQHKAIIIDTLKGT